MRATLVGNHVYVGNRCCGYIDEDRGVYVSERNHTHQFIKYGHGFGISISILDLLENLKIEWIVINYEGMKGYIANTSQFLVKGIEFKFNEDNQLILPLEEWKMNLNEEKPDNQAVLSKHLNT